MFKCDSIILGAGAAGLAAARVLHDAGRRVIVLEARDRIGGRVYTLHDPAATLPIELGAEFVHGRPRETWEILNAAHLAVYDVPLQQWHLDRGGRLGKLDDFWERVEKVLEGLSKVRRTRDMTFDQYLAKFHSRDRDKKALQLAREYVEGFNAADAGRISSVGLADAQKSSDKIEGHLLFRVADGYDGVIRALVSDYEIRLNAIVSEVRWRRGEVHVTCASGETFTARRAIITLPLAVMQTDTVRFDPEIASHRDAARRLVMGPVIKVICRFREAFWETIHRKKLVNATFLFGGDRVPIQTWWTMLAMRAPVLIGWSGGPAADALSELTEKELRSKAIESLSKLLRVSRRKIANELESIHTHNWQTDPFARGAYSYVPVGGLNAMKQLARPIERTLSFAGEHTHWQGMSGTVAGAIASGYRAAREAL